MAMTSHDVRHLVLCTGCGGLADDRSSVQPGFGQHWHPGCFVADFGEDAVFTLHYENRRKFRLCDVSPATMRRLVDDIA